MIRRPYTQIHIVGCSPRTGTTLLSELMVSSFRIDGFPEHEMSVFGRPVGAYEIVLTKRPDDVFNVRPLLWWWSDLWVVCMLRDPRDVVVSRHGALPGDYYVGLNVWKQRYPFVRALRGHPRVSVVRYEDLVRDPDGVQDALAARMPFLERQHAFSEYDRVARPSDLSQKALGGVRRVSTGSIGKWREHKPRLASQLARHGPITRELVELGYEPDDRWLEALEGVSPDDSGSFRPEVEAWRDRWHRRWWQLQHTVRFVLGLEARRELVRRPDAGERSSSRDAR